MKMKIERFGLPYNPAKEKKLKNKMAKDIIIFLIIFIAVTAVLAVTFESLIRNNLTRLVVDDVNNDVETTWINSLASYWGGIIGGVFSGVFAFLGVFFTIRYYKESDEQKTKAAIQPFLLVTVGANKDITKGFSLGQNSDEKEFSKQINITIKNIGNGFAKTLVVHTGYNLGGMSYNKVISIGNSEYIYFMVDPHDLTNGLCFRIQFIDAKRNEYIQEYTINESSGHIDIECGYPIFLKQ